MKGIGYITAKDVANWGVTGPAMRGCGVDYDVRRDDPYDAYGELEFEVPVLNKNSTKGGDTYDRFLIRIEEMYQSCEMIRQSFKKLQSLPKEAPSRVKVPRCVPAGTHVAKIEDPRGESIMYLVSAIQAQGPQSDLRQRLRIQAHGAGSEDRRYPIDHGHDRYVSRRDGQVMTWDTAAY